MRWKGRRSGKAVRWQVRKDERVVSWQGGEGGRLLRRQGGMFLVLFKSGERRVTPRFHLLFLMLINETEKQDGFKEIFLHDCRYGKTLLRSYTSC